MKFQTISMSRRTICIKLPLLGVRTFVALSGECTFLPPDGKCIASRIKEKEISNEILGMSNYEFRFRRYINFYISLLTKFPALCDIDHRRSTGSG